MSNRRRPARAPVHVSERARAAAPSGASTQDTLEKVTDADVAAYADEVRVMRRRAAEGEAAVVYQGRLRGWSWSRLSLALGVPTPTLIRRYGD